MEKISDSTAGAKIFDFILLMKVSRDADRRYKLFFTLSKPAYLTDVRCLFYVRNTLSVSDPMKIYAILPHRIFKY